MHTQELHQIRQTIQHLFADEIIDLKYDIDREAKRKTTSKDALHQVIRKERETSLHCEHCGSTHIVKNGKTPSNRQKYRCMDCGKSRSDTNNSITFSSKKSYYVWEAFIVCMLSGYSLRKIAALIDISTTTAFHWRHKVMEAMKHYDMTRLLDGDIQIDETYFLLNMKGLRTLPRKAKKRKTSSQSRGISNEHVCVLTAMDSNDQLIIEVIDQGNPTYQNIKQTLNQRMKHGQAITTDSKSTYLQVAKDFGCTLHQIPSGFHTNGIHHLGDVNELHSSMKSWFVPFKGVSTKHLGRYLAWFRFQKLLHYQLTVTKHNRKTMNFTIKQMIDFLIRDIHSTPFPIDIMKPYTSNQYFS